MTTFRRKQKSSVQIVHLVHEYAYVAGWKTSGWNRQKQTPLIETAQPGECLVIETFFDEAGSPIDQEITVMAEDEARAEFEEEEAEVVIRRNTRRAPITNTHPTIRFLRAPDLGQPV